MTAVRNHVRAIALIWLVGQAVALSAFVPGNCCVSHVEERAAREKQDACHESEPARQPEPGDACPMQHDDGDACPMHSGKSSDRCVMTNACEGPAAHLLSMFAYVGTIERPLSTEVTLHSAAAFIQPSSSLLHRFSTPDSPPPKA